MTICKVCGKDNKADYTFCLGCGAELKGAAAPQPARAPSAGGAAPAPGGLGGAPGLGSLGLPLPAAPRSPTPPLTPAAVAAPMPGRDDRERSLSAGWAIEPAVAASHNVSAPAPATPLFKAPIPPEPEQLPTKVGGLPAGMSGSRPIAPAPAPVPVPSRPTPAAVPSVPRPAAPLAPSPVAMPVAPSAPVAAAPAPEAAGTRPCPNCHSPVPAEFAFCGSCGSRVAPATAGAGAAARAPEPAPAVSGPPPSASQAAAAALARGKIVLIRPDGSEGASLTLVEGENVIGRAMGPLFENDGYLSPRHAEIVINAAGCVVRDLKSLNGVYFKMQHEEPLESGDIFRLGQELLRFDLLPPAAPLDDGTEVMGSPNVGYWGRISLVIGREIDGNAWPVGGDGVTLGRERGDINFPDDGYVSGLHARLAFASGRVTLTDLHSSNGTFMRVRSQRVLENGALVQFGQQLFRLQLS
ncbi:MAG: FHA domain-containing protein [Deltaproteobacteria bacterium]|nr:FHA domain-containing protein [Deltaproteobacteria bacterium]